MGLLPAAPGTRRSREDPTVKMGGKRSLFLPYLLLILISTGACVKWTGEFSNPLYKGELQIQDKNGSYHFTVQFSADQMEEELGKFSEEEPTPDSYSLFLSSNSCGGAWKEGSLGYIAANETVEGVEDMTEGQSIRLLQCPAEAVSCLLEMEELDCAPITKNNTFNLSIEIIIVLIVAGLIFVIIVICIPILYCCIKSRSSQKKKFKLGEEEGEGDSIDDPFLMDLDKRHTKSELSIPYMDASLPPTPKGGRSGFRLADLLGNNNKGSETSLSEKPM